MEKAATIEVLNTECNDFKTALRAEKDRSIAVLEMECNNSMTSLRAEKTKLSSECIRRLLGEESQCNNSLHGLLEETNAALKMECNKSKAVLNVEWNISMADSSRECKNSLLEKEETLRVEWNISMPDFSRQCENSLLEKEETLRVEWNDSMANSSKECDSLLWHKYATLRRECIDSISDLYRKCNNSLLKKDEMMAALRVEWNAKCNSSLVEKNLESLEALWNSLNECDNLLWQSDAEHAILNAAIKNALRQKNENYNTLERECNASFAEPSTEHEWNYAVCVAAWEESLWRKEAALSEECSDVILGFRSECDSSMAELSVRCNHLL